MDDIAFLFSNVLNTMIAFKFFMSPLILLVKQKKNKANLNFVLFCFCCQAHQISGRHSVIFTSDYLQDFQRSSPYTHQKYGHMCQL